MTIETYSEKQIRNSIGNDNQEWMAVDKIQRAWNKLMDKTDELHNLECGSCDDDVEEFIKEMGFNKK